MRGLTPDPLGEDDRACGLLENAALAIRLVD